MDSKLACFEKFDIRTFKERFKVSCTDLEVTREMTLLETDVYRESGEGESQLEEDRMVR